ncbi:hypothetical protein CO174_03335 [Candidatus Uhrbacteria bacterium CG_4_9_14_3_um_filter_50_9]|uniref:Uncharacterized protein n=1 Tax=Candidatus Uhrbacteria bacterium CG_4_9_14_3_um_filter_50_9 TaxID=1975035 RepID=A0A2M7XC20_9BACT|nr:MAG: hypothetical protein CO174_03335 [Candidatus Uhrbacteria bacterium CG_4_9_14_3_um_filter_50_9]
MKPAINPVTGTRSIDEQVPMVDQQRLLVFIDRKTEVVTCVDTLELGPGVHTHIGIHDRVPLGAVIVRTRGAKGGIPICVVYRDLLRAMRGEGYAEDYYDEEIPTLTMALGDAHWALQAVHDSDDLRDPEMVAEREERLIAIIRLAAEGSSEYKERAGANAERALQLLDKLGRGNPMAAAMANWGVTVQLDKQLLQALGAGARVSKSHLAIVQALTRIWESIRHADIELASMGRWWSPGRKQPLDLAQAVRLASRVERIAAPLKLIHAAPYAQMPLMLVLADQLDELGRMLCDEERFMNAGPLVHLIRESLGLLLIHRRLAQALIVPAKARRFKRAFTDIEVQKLNDDVHTLLTEVRVMEHSLSLGNPGLISSRLVVGLSEALYGVFRQFQADEVSPEKVYEGLQGVLDLYKTH